MLELKLIPLIGLCTLIASTPGCASNASDVVPATSAAAKPASIVRTPWGSVDGKPVTLFTLTNKHGLELKVLSYGGIITELRVPDRNGKLDDIVLGFDDLESYREKTPYFGAVIGRIANRISGARFSLDGKEYQLAANDGKNSLHGGKKGWDKVVWTQPRSIRPQAPSCN